MLMPQPPLPEPAPKVPPSKKGGKEAIAVLALEAVNTVLRNIGPSDFTLENFQGTGFFVLLYLTILSFRYFKRK